MEKNDQPSRASELPPKAQRAIYVIYIAMAALMLIPVVFAWILGAFQF